MLLQVKLECVILNISVERWCKFGPYAYDWKEQNNNKIYRNASQSVLKLSSLICIIIRLPWPDRYIHMNIGILKVLARFGGVWKQPGGVQISMPEPLKPCRYQELRLVFAAILLPLGSFCCQFDKRTPRQHQWDIPNVALYPILLKKAGIVIRRTGYMFVK